MLLIHGREDTPVNRIPATWREGYPRQAEWERVGSLASQWVGVSGAKCHRCGRPLARRNRTGFCATCQRSHGLPTLRRTVLFEAERPSRARKLAEMCLGMFGEDLTLGYPVPKPEAVKDIVALAKLILAVDD